jgi:hypothetical protein
MTTEELTPHRAASDKRAGRPTSSRMPITWWLGVLTDRVGRVHLGAVLVDQSGEPCEYVSLLSAAGVTTPDDLDLTHVLVLGHAEQISEFRQVVERCVDDDRLRNQLVQLTDLSTCVGQGHRWTSR